MTGQLEQVLALEHEAVWTYGLIGGGFAPLRDQAEASFAAHRTERDRLLAVVEDALPPQVAYAPATIADEAAARLRAQDVEARLAAAWSAVIGSTTGSDRTEAIDQLVVAEAARLAWGGSPAAFPGLD
ncbi:DUF4439 domain-containing protein [Aeromicrobium sp. Leaf350]|uniref:DUF4439 domain-containing protein n=1 Tax=Aeromicrobium sp. Leaf350 TaxID=2876565 RepID=UPI001E638E8A|nr:DUF4439 domain-containing protein [Aeromicrobium sp. Leaf350]